jgi:hypothetical protein
MTGHLVLIFAGHAKKKAEETHTQEKEDSLDFGLLVYTESYVCHSNIRVANLIGNYCHLFLDRNHLTALDDS